MSTVQSPSKIELSLGLDRADAHHQKVTVELPSKGGVPKIDVYFLADRTSSMSPVLRAVKAGASQILDKLTEEAERVGADLRVGVGGYTDTDYAEDRWFVHQVSPTHRKKEIKKGLDDWEVFPGGETYAEGQFYALDRLAQPPGGSIGWRDGSKRVVLWIGDAPGHDPLCTALTGLSHDITEESVTEKLRQEEIVVLAVSVPTDSEWSAGLNVDPGPRSRRGEHQQKCGIGGSEGQAERIAARTRGDVADGIKPDLIAATIIKLGTGEIARTGSVRLVPDKKIAPFVRVTPSEGFGPLDAGTRSVDFTLRFPGLKAGASGGSSKGSAPVTVRGNIAVKVDGVTTGTIPVTVEVPDLSGTYIIRCTGSDLALQLHSPSWTGDGANVAQNHCNGALAERWELIPAGSGGYRVRNMDPARKRHLEVAGESRKEGTEILTREDPGGRHKEWLFLPVGISDDHGPVFRIENRNSGMVADIEKSQIHTPGIVLRQYGYWGDHETYKEDHNQHWYLEKA